MKKIWIAGTILFVVSGIVFSISSCQKDRNIITVVYTDKTALGKQIFFDKNLSNPAGQSCSSCHNPQTAFSDQVHSPVSEGAVAGLFGNRNAPGITYSMFIPPLSYNETDDVYIGGLFLDGRVNSLEEQAQKPFLNRLEMNNTGVDMVIAKIRGASYYPLYKQVFGEITDNKRAFDNIAEAIASFERTPELNSFSSKFDFFLKGQASLTEQEQRGMQLFNDDNKGKCASCHLTTPDDASGKILFTDFTYDNIGVPKNPTNPFYFIPLTFNPDGASAIDAGLGKTLNNNGLDGSFRVPTLRNVALTAPYFHNGIYNTLEEVVHFYNKRDVESFPPAEIPLTVNKTELGNLNLTAQDEKDIVAFMKTLTDGYK